MWILWVFARGNTMKHLCVQLLMTPERRLSVALRMPLELLATAPAFLDGCGDPWWEVSRRMVTIMEDVLSAYCQCTLSAITHEWNTSRRMLICARFLAPECRTRAPNLQGLSGEHCLYVYITSHWFISEDRYGWNFQRWSWSIILIHSKIRLKDLKKIAVTVYRVMRLKDSSLFLLISSHDWLPPS